MCPGMLTASAWACWMSLISSAYFLYPVARYSLNRWSAEDVHTPGAACLFWLLAQTAPAILPLSRAIALPSGNCGLYARVQDEHSAAWTPARVSHPFFPVYWYSAMKDSRRPNAVSESASCEMSAHAPPVNPRDLVSRS